MIKYSYINKKYELYKCYTNGLKIKVENMFNDISTYLIYIMWN